MIEKMYEREYHGYLMKGYRCDSVYSVIDKITQSDVRFERVEVSDKGDVGMKYFGGDYSYEEFLSIYDRIRLDIDTLSLTLPGDAGSVEISTDDKSVIILTKDGSLKIEDLIKG